jgi:predicted DNA-binding protein (MmcQ/YjbR family)
MSERTREGEPRDLDPLLEPLREYLLSKPGSVEEYPFGPEVMVFKVGGKMFGLLAWQEVPVYVSLKCDPERSQQLREAYSGINGAYHMNKQHWHSVAMDGSVGMELTQELVDHSYDLIVATLPGKVRQRLQGM